MVNPIRLEYLQIIETGHAANAFRDSAGELIVSQPPADAGEKESKEKHSGCSNRDGDMKISENIQIKEAERSREGVHSQRCHLRHLHNRGRDRATQLIVAEAPADASE